MVYRTMQGRVIDLEKLMRQNELTPAIGNMKVNARGDEIGSGGKITKRREEIVAEYYETNPNSKPKRTSTVVEQKQEQVIPPKSEIVKKEYKPKKLFTEETNESTRED